MRVIGDAGGDLPADWERLYVRAPSIIVVPTTDGFCVPRCLVVIQVKSIS